MSADSQAAVGGGGRERSPQFLALHTGIGLIASTGLGVVAAIFVARAVGAAGQGRYQTFIAIVMFAAMLARLGLDEAVSYLIPRYRERHPAQVGALAWYAISRATALAAILALAIYGAAPWLDRVLPFDNFVVELRLVAPVTIVFVAFALSTAVLRGLDRADARALVQYYIVAGLFAVVSVLLWWNESSLESFYVGRGLTFVVGAAVGGALCVRYIRPHRGSAPSEPLSRLQRRTVWSFGGAMVFVALFDHITQHQLVDLIVLRYFVGDDIVGVYSVAGRLAALAGLVSLAVLVVIGPKLSRLHAAGRVADMRDMYRRTARWMALLSLFALGAATVLANEALAVFGSEFTSGVRLLWIFVASRAVIGVLGPNTAALLGAGKVRTELWLSGCAAAVFLVAAIILGDRFGAVGVAFATGGTIAALELARAIACATLLETKLPLGQIATAVAITGCALAAGFAIKATVGTLYARAITSGAVYCAVFAGLALATGVRAELRNALRP